MKFLTIFLTLFIVSLLFHSLSAQTYDKSKSQNNPEVVTGLEEPYESGKYVERKYQSTGINWQNPMTLDLTEPVHFPYQDPNTVYVEAVPISLSNGQILMVWSEWDILNCAHSTDGGVTWGTPIEITSVGDRPYYISGIQTSSGRVLTVWREASSGLWSSYSDDDGSSWSEPNQVTTDGGDRYTNLSQTLDLNIWLFYSRNTPGTQYDLYYRNSSDNGITWSSEQTFVNTTSDERYAAVVSSTGSSLLAIYVDDSNGNQDIFMTSSTDNGSSWSAGVEILNSPENEFWPRLLRHANGDLWIVFLINKPTPVLPGRRQADVYYTQSSDDGATWAIPTQFTNYAGYDSWNNVDLYNDQPLVTFCSWRWAPNIGQRQVWYGLIGTTQDLNPPPAVFEFSPSIIAAGIPMDFRAFVDDETGVDDVQMYYNLNGDQYGPFQMLDDGDNIWGAAIGPFQVGDFISYSLSVSDISANTVNVEGGSFDIPLIHDAGNLILNFRPNSQIADMMQTSGSNAYWPSVNGDDYLYQGGLWIGWDGLGDQRVMNLHYFDRDWQQTPGSVITIAPGISDQDGSVTYDDQSANGPSTGLKVHQESYQWSDPIWENFIIFRYTITNTGENGNLTDLYTTLWSDPDLGDPQIDLGGYDSQRGLIYLYDSQSNPNGYIGFKLLGTGNIPHTATIERPPLNNDFDRFNYMTSGFPTLPTDPRDYDMLLTAQPFNLTVGSSRVIAFGLVMGGNLAELQENADKMEEIYNTIPVGGGNMLVTNTDDSGPGSLRDAIVIANNDGDVSLIEFAPGLMGHTIMPETELPALTEDNTTIDGDINNDGIPDIEISSSTNEISNGLVVESAFNTIKGLVISNFYDNHEWYSGGGINIRGLDAHDNLIKGCYIGTDLSGGEANGNKIGIKLESGAHHNTVGSAIFEERNLISGNQRGILLNDENTNYNVLIGNYIGQNVSSEYSIPNYDGIYLYQGPSYNRIGGGNPGEANVVLFNNRCGIRIYSPDFNSIRNTITQNSISENSGDGIAFVGNVNENITAPFITDFDGSTLTGITVPNSTIEVFADPFDEGAEFLGEVMSDGLGNFSYSGDLPDGWFFNVTVTDANGNTSEFSGWVRQSEINANNWRVQLLNNGTFAQDVLGLISGGAGGEFPKGSGIYILYSGGHYLGTLKNSIPSVSQSEFTTTDYLPGKIINSNPAPLNQLSVDNPLLAKNKVYVIDSTRSGDDWNNWPADDGAPVDVNGDPLLLSPQDSWVIFNDVNPQAHSGTDEPVLGLEVQRSTYSYTVPGAMADAFIVKWRITNKSINNYTDTYFGAFFDPDVDDASNDLLGTDTTLNMIYCYNADDSDAPQAFGACLLKGSLVDGQILGLTATFATTGAEMPQNDEERYNIQKGLDRWGNTKPFGLYDYTGDPIAITGILDWNPTDKEVIISSGPFTFYAGNTQEIVIACIGAVGTNRLDAVAKLKETTKLVQEFYNRPTVTLSQTKGVKTFKTPVRITLNNVTNLLGADFKIQYDKSILRLKASDVVLTPLTSNFIKSVNVIQNQGLVSIALANSTPLDAVLNGVLVKLPFKVKNGASVGDISDLIFSESLLTFQNDSLQFNETLPVNGSMEVVDGVLFGDVNQNGELDLIDVVLILKVLIEMLNEVTPFQELLADATQDGNVNLVDALTVLDQLVLNKPGSVLASVPDTTIDVNLNLPLIQGDIGQEVIVPVRASDLDQLLGLNLVLAYDHNALQLESIEQTGSTDLLASNTQAPGRVYLAVINQDGIGNPDEDLVNLVFEVLEEGQHTLIVEKSEGVQAGKDLSETIPDVYAFYQNYPNPFNPVTTIKYDLPEAAKVVLMIYNILGEEVATLVNGEKDAGRYQVDFNASALASGVYIYRLKANDFVESKKMILLK